MRLLLLVTFIIVATLAINICESNASRTKYKMKGGKEFNKLKALAEKERKCEIECKAREVAKMRSLDVTERRGGRKFNKQKKLAEIERKCKSECEENTPF